MYTNPKHQWQQSGSGKEHGDGSDVASHSQEQLQLADTEVHSGRDTGNKTEKPTSKTTTASRNLYGSSGSLAGDIDITSSQHSRGHKQTMSMLSHSLRHSSSMSSVLSTENTSTGEIISGKRWTAVMAGQQTLYSSNPAPGLPGRTVVQYERSPQHPPQRVSKSAGESK